MLDFPSLLVHTCVHTHIRKNNFVMRFQPSEGLGRAESPGNGSCPANTVSDKKKHGKSK